MAELRQWEVDALAVRQELRIDVLDAEQYDPGFPPSPLAEFQAWFEGILDEIPEEYRSTATIEFSSTGSYYDSHYGSVEVTYRRPETDEEWAERKRDVLARLEQYRVQQEHRERAALAALKAKYEKEHGTNA